MYTSVDTQFTGLNNHVSIEISGRNWKSIGKSTMGMNGSHCREIRANGWVLAHAYRCAILFLFLSHAYKDGFGIKAEESCNWLAGLDKVAHLCDPFAPCHVLFRSEMDCRNISDLVTIGNIFNPHILVLNPLPHCVSLELSLSCRISNYPRLQVSLIPLWFQSYFSSVRTLVIFFLHFMLFPTFLEKINSGNKKQNVFCLEKQ